MQQHFHGHADCMEVKLVTTLRDNHAMAYEKGTICLKKCCSSKRSNQNYQLKGDLKGDKSNSNPPGRDFLNVVSYPRVPDLGEVRECGLQVVQEALVQVAWLLVLSVILRTNHRNHNSAWRAFPHRIRVENMVRSHLQTGHPQFLDRLTTF